MKIIKVINNNNVCILDEKGREQIVSGKGIGFGKKYGDSVEPSHIFSQIQHFRKGLWIL